MAKELSQIVKITINKSKLRMSCGKTVVKKLINYIDHIPTYITQFR